MIELLSRIRSRLAHGAFPNEAAVSHGLLVPLLQALNWDPAEPDQVMPEYSSGRGRVDFALCGSPARPSVFIEVKGVGRSLDGDRQLFVSLPTAENGAFTCQVGKVATRIAGYIDYKLTIDPLRILKLPFSVT